MKEGGVTATSGGMSFLLPRQCGLTRFERIVIAIDFVPPGIDSPLVTAGGIGVRVLSAFPIRSIESRSRQAVEASAREGGA